MRLGIIKMMYGHGLLLSQKARFSSKLDSSGL
jgi:hypothetical protein